MPYMILHKRCSCIPPVPSSPTNLASPSAATYSEAYSTAIYVVDRILIEEMAASNSQYLDLWSTVLVLLMCSNCVLGQGKKEAVYYQYSSPDNEDHVL